MFYKSTLNARFCKSLEAGGVKGAEKLRNYREQATIKNVQLKHKERIKRNLY
jgi:hypothetical protein